MIHGGGVLFPQVGGLQIGQVQLYRDGVLIKRHTDGKIPAPGGVVKTAHVPADGRGLGGLQPYKPLDEKDALFTVAVGESVLDLIKRHLFPLAGLVVFDIPGADLVKLCLADIMQKENHV